MHNKQTAIIRVLQFSKKFPIFATTFFMVNFASSYWNDVKVNSTLIESMTWNCNYVFFGNNFRWISFKRQCAMSTPHVENYFWLKYSVLALEWKVYIFSSSVFGNDKFWFRLSNQSVVNSKNCGLFVKWQRYGHFEWIKYWILSEKCKV